MKISLNWLKQYIQTGLPVEKIGEILTDTGLEVEAIVQIETIKGGLKGVIVGEVLTKEKHPDADRLNVTTVEIGNGEPLQIVCGAPNVAAGQKVLVATSGTTLYPDPENPFKIKKSKIRGVESNGMICAEDELGLGTDHDGILVLDPETKIGTPAAEHFKIEDDYLIEIGLTPNRSDAMGHVGVARDLKAYLNFHENTGLEINHPKVDINVPDNKGISLKIEDPEACPRYSGAVIKGLKVNESPDWLQNRLRAIGLSPINNVVDITNYILHGLGNPLHAFDLAKVGKEIVVRKARKGEKLVTLDEVERELDTDDLMICNAIEPMCIAGVFGGIDSGVSESTTEIFLEAAYFNPVSVRKTAKRHGLNTDSSFRFERGVDPNNVDYALKLAVSMILEIAGGELVAVQDVYPDPIKNLEISLDYNRCRKLTGADISSEEIKSILKELEIELKSDSGESGNFSVPTFRAEVTREADLIEEVLRIYGFNRVPLPEKLNSSISFREKPEKEKLRNVAADFLVNNGWYEILNNSLTSSAIGEKIKSDHLKPEEAVSILNPLSNELDILRQTMLFGGLKSIEYNRNRQYPDLKLFEFGKAYKKSKASYEESNRLAIWLTGQDQPENWTQQQQKSDFYMLKGIVEGLFGKLGIWKNPASTPLKNDLLEDGYTISITGKKVATIGWVRKDILAEFDIKDSVFYADVDWDNIIELSVMNTIRYSEIQKTQFVRRDFSLLLNQSVKFGDIREIAEKVDRKILQEIGLFDVYEGKNLEKGKKSYAVSFIFQDPEKTLKDKQVDAIMDRIRASLESELGAELR